VRNDTTCILYKQGATAADFTDVSADAKLTSVGKWIGSSWADYDSDGRRDLYLLSDGGDNQLYNNKTTGFELVVAPATKDAGKARSAAWGDYDNDGRLDLLLVNDGGALRLMRQTSGADFTPSGAGPLQQVGPGRSGILGDYDNDGDLDIFVTQCGERDRLIRNDGGGTFVDLGALVFSGADSSTGAAWGDYDNDGDLDLLVADQDGATRLYQNDYAGTNNWLKVRPVGRSRGEQSPGAQVRIWLADETKQVREISAGGGYYSSDEAVAHFGLGAATQVDSMVVTWPSGESKSLTNQAAGQLLVVAQPAASAVDDGDEFGRVPKLVTGLRSIYPNPFNPATQVLFELGQREPVRVRIYDVAGRLVQELWNESLDAGQHKVVWHGRDRTDRTVAAGVYFVRLQIGDQGWTRSIVLVK